MPSIGDSFAILKSVDSTNNYAMAQVHAGLAQHGNAYLALEQTAGKGQRGRDWRTGSGENIAISIVLEPKGLLLSDQFHLSVTVALSCYDLVKKYAGNETTIKWPNDVYIGDRKAGGILIENAVKGSLLQFCIAGIGLNVNQTKFDEALPNPVSLKQITGENYDIVLAGKELCTCIEKRFRQLASGAYLNLLDEYNAILYKLNQPVKLKRNNILFHTVIKGVDKQGRLLTKQGLMQSYEFGEVEWLIK